MKNMKVSKKLMVGFSVVIAFAILIGVVGVFAVFRLRDASNDLYEKQTKMIVNSANIVEQVQFLRIQLRVLAIQNQDLEDVDEIGDDIKERLGQMDQYMNAYQLAIEDEGERLIFEEGYSIYTNDFKTILNEVVADAKAGKSAEDIMNRIAPYTDGVEKMVENFKKCLEMRLEFARITADDNAELARIVLIVVSVVLVFSILSACLLGARLSKRISEPLKSMSLFLEGANTTGSLELKEKDLKIIQKYVEVKDEIGMSVRGCAGLIGRMSELSERLKKVAEGDMTVKIDVLSEEDVMGNSASKMIASLNHMFGELRMASEQVASGSEQISQGAQGLAAGSSEQAAKVEELSAALEKLQEKTRRNAENSKMAQEVNAKSEGVIQESIGSMEEMLKAMKEIDESSKSITKVIKVIDDIAFQTNILALNAAVEAARAGTHGKGFAVVAEEVRNLASKSSEAAKETAALIEGSSERVTDGNQIVRKTNASLEAVAESSRENTRLIKEVAAASVEQARAIQEINQSVNQISNVVQENSATSEESAAASQEMSAQAAMLNQIVSRFRLKDDATTAAFSGPPRPEAGEAYRETFDGEDSNEARY